MLTPFVAAAAFLGTVRALRVARAGTFALAILAWLSLLTLVERDATLPTRVPLRPSGLRPRVHVRPGWNRLARQSVCDAGPAASALRSQPSSLILFYAAYSLAAFHDRGVLGRRLGMLSPVRPGQCETRAFIAWLEQTMTDKSPAHVTMRREPLSAPWAARLDRVGQGPPIRDIRGWCPLFTTDAATRLRLRKRQPGRDLVASQAILWGLSLTDGPIDDHFSRRREAGRWRLPRLADDATHVRELRVTRSLRRGSRRQRASLEPGRRLRSLDSLRSAASRARVRHGL